MGLLRWMWTTFAMFVALLVMLSSGWLLVANLVDTSYSGLVLAWILLSGAAGVGGGILYSMTFHGPSEIRRWQLRSAGWAAMFAGSIIPTTLRVVALPLLLAIVPTLFQLRSQHDSVDSVTSS